VTSGSREDGVEEDDRDDRHAQRRGTRQHGKAGGDSQEQRQRMGELAAELPQPVPLSTIDSPRKGPQIPRSLLSLT
jgi:hypothetical protein